MYGLLEIRRKKKYVEKMERILKIKNPQHLTDVEVSDFKFHGIGLIYGKSYNQSKDIRKPRGQKII